MAITYNSKIMNKLKIIAAFAALVTVLVGCSKESQTDMTGEWKLVSVSGIPADELGHSEVYVQFDANRFFTWERIPDTDRYKYYSGTYSVDGSSASGIYEDGSSWGAVYEVARDGKTLVMSVGGRDNLYEASAIPDKVRENAVPGVDLKSNDNQVRKLL